MPSALNFLICPRGNFPGLAMSARPGARGPWTDPEARDGQAHLIGVRVHRVVVHLEQAAQKRQAVDVVLDQLTAGAGDEVAQFGGDTVQHRLVRPAGDQPVLVEAQEFSSANERMISHTEHELAESDIIQLPVQNFPEPQCEYSMHEFHKNGRRIMAYVSRDIFMSHTFNADR